MNIENELKLIPNKEVSREQIIEMLSQKGIVIQKEGKIVHQEDTYFDDKDGTLEKSGGSFRIRRKKDKIAVTYKMPIESDTEYKQRKEYEITVPDEYMETGIDMQTAIELLKKQYPEINFPEDMGEILTVINDRNKTNLVCPDGTVVEMAFDTLKGRDGNGKLYYVQPEIEFEIQEGNPENLTTIYNTIVEKFERQFTRNTLSKYARTKKEIAEKQLTVKELATCTILSAGLNSIEFSKLNRKGQILHKYDREVETNLDNFKNFNYLVEKLADIKRGNYQTPITLDIQQKLENNSLLSDELKKNNFKIVDTLSLEDMFCILMSSESYDVKAEILSNFLNDNYFNQYTATTNRLSHSQQVMLAVGLACNSEHINSSFEEKITAMTAALYHDIGHVPFSHNMEELMAEIMGAFGHEANGKRVINELREEKKLEMINQILSARTDVDNVQIINSLDEMGKSIETSIEEHSTKRCAKRGTGIVAQGPRMADKTSYVISDIRDLLKALKENNVKFEELFSDEWIESTIIKRCEEIYKEENIEKEGERTEIYESIKAKIYETIINPIQNEDYGRAMVNIINSIRVNYKTDNKIRYNIDFDIWDFIKATIKQTTKIRDEYGLDGDRENWEIIQQAILANTIKGSSEIEKIKAQRIITRAGEKEEDIIGLCSCLRYGQMKGIEPILPKDYANIRNELKTYLKEELIYRGEDKRTVSKEVDEYVAGMTEEDLLHTYLNKKGVLPQYKLAWLEEIKQRADSQLKIVPNEQVQIDGILKVLGISKKGETQTMHDKYFLPEDTHMTIQARTVFTQNGKNNRQTFIIVKVNPDRQKTQALQRTRFCKEVPDNATIEEQLQIIKQVYSDIKPIIKSKEPYGSLYTDRTVFAKTNNKGKIIMTVQHDRGFNCNTHHPFEQIEIRTEPSKMKGIITKLKAKFGEDIKFTQETKGNIVKPNENSSKGEDRFDN